MANVLREPDTLSSMHPGRSCYLNLFKCIYSDYERPHTGQCALGGASGEQWVSDIVLVRFQLKCGGNHFVCLLVGLHKPRKPVWVIPLHRFRDSVY